MNCNEIKELIDLYFEEESDNGSLEIISEHCKKCESCEEYFQKEKTFTEMMGSVHLAVPRDDLLERYRANLNIILNHRQKARKSSSFFHYLYAHKYGISTAIAMLAIGLFVGIIATSSLLGNYQIAYQEKPDFINVTDIDFQKENVQISLNVINQEKMNGTIQNEKIRNMLFKLLNDAKPDTTGVRNHVIEVVKHEIDRNGESNKSILINELIKTLHNDPNIGIRNRVLQIIDSLDWSNQIKQAVIYCLKNDPKSSVRMKALDILDNHLDDDVINTFIELEENTENKYLKHKARQILFDKVYTEMESI